MAERDVNAEIKQLRDDFATLRNDVSELTALLRDLGVERFEGAKDAAADELRASREELRRRLQAARATGRDAVEDIGETIGGHALSSIGMAFGVGFLLAKLLDIGSRR